MAQPPANIDTQTFIKSVDHVIRERKTTKVLADLDDCSTVYPELDEEFNTAVREVVEVAGWAPFHKLASEVHRGGALDSVVPWRFYILDQAACCGVLNKLRALAAENNDPKWGRALAKKIPRLLAGAGALVMVTWLPDPSPTGEPVLNENNIEHIAAASAATQNILLAGEARNMHTYWCTGGILMDGAIFDLIGIPRQEKLLGAIFLAPVTEASVEFVPGAHRDERGQNWMTWVDADTLK